MLNEIDHQWDFAGRRRRKRVQNGEKMLLNYYPEKRDFLDLLSGGKRLPMGVIAATQLFR